MQTKMSKDTTEIINRKRYIKERISEKTSGRGKNKREDIRERKEQEVREDKEAMNSHEGSSLLFFPVCPVDLFVVVIVLIKVMQRRKP